MLTVTNRKRTPPKQERKSFKSWLKGYMSALDDGRMPEDGLAVANDVVLSQNGTVKPAMGSALYGTQPPGTVQGQVYPFTRNNSGTIENYVCALIKVGGVVDLYYQKDGGAWVKASGKTFNANAVGRFSQIKSVVLVASKTDNLCWFNTDTQSMVVQTALTDPVTPTAVPVTGITGTNFTYRYRYSAVNVGESAGSTAGTCQTSLARDQWDGTTQWVTLTLTRVTNAVGYNIYVGTNAGEEAFLTYVADPGSGTTFTFRDDAAIATDITRVAPDVNTSALPVLSYVKVLNDRVYGWGDAADKWKIWYGGTTNENKLKFSSWFGGGWTRVANGTPYIPNGIVMYRTGKGDPAITIFCRSASGGGKRYIMAENTLTEGDTVITIMGVQEDNSAYGTDSPDGLVMAEDDVFYPSKDSFKKTGNKVNVPNILTSKGISDAIERDVEALNASAMDKCVGLYYQGVIYWSVPYGYGVTSNNQLWALDIRRGGAWMLPISVSADWIWVYEDSDGLSHFCYLTPESKILELSHAYATTRNGVSFSTAIQTGLIKFSEDGQEWAQVEKVKYVLIRPQGYITADVTGKTEDEPLAQVGSSTFTPTTSITGIGEEAIGEYYIGELRNAPIKYGSSREELEVDIDEEVQWLQCSLRSSGANVEYELSDIILYYVNVGVKD
jgi:hypothetical protein